MRSTIVMVGPPCIGAGIVNHLHMSSSKNRSMLSNTTGCHWVQKICTGGFFNMLNPNFPSDLNSDYSRNTRFNCYSIWWWTQKVLTQSVWLSFLLKKTDLHLVKLQQDLWVVHRLYWSFSFLHQTDHESNGFQSL